jgi:hypothetical protein
MTISDCIKAQLDEAEHVIRQQMARIADLEQENERLKEGLTAHQTLRQIYSDETQPTGHRIKAAIGSLPHETPKLMSVPPPLELTGEPVVPLAELVEARRARQNQLCPQSAEHLPPIDVLPIADGRSRNGNGGNGSDEGSSD